MPDDQLSLTRAEAEHDPAGARIAPHETAQGVLAVLAGVPLQQAAAHIRMQPADLAEALQVYRTAGYAALKAQADDRSWYQVRVQFTDWDAAEHTVATHLGPHLQQIQDTGMVTAWWFIRKAPCWRLRLQRGATTAIDDMKTAVRAVLDSHLTAGRITRWRETLYEPETAAFGGPPGMDIAHDLFHADSHSILEYLRHPRPTAPGDLTIGRRELSVLLCSALLQGAGQEWHEQGDMWHRVMQLRPPPLDTPTDRMPDLASGLRQLMTADTRPTGGLFGPDGPLAFAAPWVTAFDQAGRALGAAAGDGTLQRGLRDILAHHVIFHWNRLGLATRTQAVLAQAARDTVLNPPISPPGARPAESSR